MEGPREITEEENVDAEKYLKLKEKFGHLSLDADVAVKPDDEEAWKEYQTWQRESRELKKLTTKRHVDSMVDKDEQKQMSDEEMNRLKELDKKWSMINEVIERKEQVMVGDELKNQLP